MIPARSRCGRPTWYPPVFRCGFSNGSSLVIFLQQNYTKIHGDSCSHNMGYMKTTFGNDTMGNNIGNNMGNNMGNKLHSWDIIWEIIIMW